MRKRLIALGIALSLGGCSLFSADRSPLAPSELLEIEAKLSTQLSATPSKDAQQISLENLTDAPLSLAYQLFGFDENGVSQAESGWQTCTLAPRNKIDVPLGIYGASGVYRLYVKSAPPAP